MDNNQETADQAGRAGPGPARAAATLWADAADAASGGERVPAQPGRMPGRPDPPVAEVRSPMLTFPQISRLELDDRLEQLVEQAQDVLNTQGRLRGLLAATKSISGDLQAPVLLRRIVDAAAELLRAGQATLGVIGPEGELAEVLTARTAGACAAAGADGRSILSQLVGGGRPGAGLRGDGGTGRPPGTDLVQRSFLAVPVRGRTGLLGHLVVTGKGGAGSFSAEDQELLAAFAAAAGVAIENARLYEAAQLRPLWSSVSAEIVAELLGDPATADPLTLIAARACDVVPADLTAILVPAPDAPDVLVVAAAGGARAGEFPGELVPRRRTLAGQVLAEGRAATMDGPGAAGLPLGGAPDGPAMAVPVGGTPEVPAGVLCLYRAAGARAYDAREQDLVLGFAGLAGLALELGSGRRARRDLALVRDHDRIAGDLHDLVVQRLFATGLSLASLARRTQEAGTRERLDEFTGDLDDTTRAVRRTIDRLHQQPDAGGLRSQVVAAVARLTPVLGFAPELHLDGPVDALVDDTTAAAAVEMLCQALTEVSVPATARSAQIYLCASDPSQLVVTIVDDGCARPDPVRTSALRALRRRAEELGGSCTAGEPGTAEEGGTRLRWSIPLR